MQVKIAIPGCAQYHIDEVSVLPPLGTILQVHKNISRDGSAMTVKVVKHEWRLDDVAVEETYPKPEFVVTLITEEI